MNNQVKLSIVVYGDAAEDKAKKTRISIESICEVVPSQLLVGMSVKHALSQCCGDWILLLREGDYVEGIDGIVDFLNNPSDGVDSVSLKCRKYGDMWNNEYTTVIKTVLFRNASDIYILNEESVYCYPDYETRACISGVLHSFEYSYQSQEERYRNYSKRVKPLEEKLKNPQVHFIWNIAMMDVQANLGMYDDIIKNKENWIHASKEETGFSSDGYSSLQAGLIEAYIQRNRQEEAIEAFDRAMSDACLSPLGKDFLCKEMVRFFYEQKEFERAFVCGKQYLGDMVAYQKTEDWRSWSELPFLRETYDSHWNEACLLTWISAIEQNDEEWIDRCLGLLQGDKHDLGYLLEHCTPTLLDIIEAKEESAKYAEWIQQLIQLPGGDYRGGFYHFVAKRDNLSDGMIHTISLLEDDNEWVWFCKIIQANRDGNEDCIPELFEHFFESITDIFAFSDTVWKIGQLHDVPLESLFVHSSLWKYVTYGSIFNMRMGRKEWEEKTFPILAWKTLEDDHYFLIEINRMLQQMRWDKEEQSAETRKAYSEKVVDYFRQVYTEEAIKERTDELPMVLQKALSYVGGE